MNRLRAALAVLLAAGSLSLASFALAHADVPLIEGVFDLAPREELVVPTALHYHRLALRYQVSGTTGATVSLRVVKGSDPDALVDTPETATMLRASLSGRGSLSRLIPCCDDVAYQEMLVALRNESEQRATVELRAMAVHDDFAVVARRAESGAATVPAALFGLLGLGAWGAVRRHQAAGERSARSAPWMLRTSAVLFAASVAAAAALGLAGMVRYGGGPVDAMMAIMADLPIPGGPFGARGALAMGVLLLGWLAAHGTWYAAVAAGAGSASQRGATRRAVGWLGAALAATSLVGGVAMGAAYGSWVPPTLAVLLVGPVLPVLATLRMYGTSTARAGDLRAR